MTMNKKEKCDIVEKLIWLYQEKNNLTIRIAREYVIEIMDIIEDIAKTKIIDDSIFVALTKLIDLKSILVEEDCEPLNTLLKD